MKNIIFGVFGVFIFYGLIHDFFGNSDLIATIITALVLLVIYFRQKSLQDNRPKYTSTEYLINDKNRWEKMITDDEKNSNSPGYKQAKAEEELNEAQEIIDNYKNNQKD